MQFTIHTIEDWQEVVDSILPQLQHNILLLKGNLGAGKTTFSQVLLKNLGSTDEVSSPTYSIVNEYSTPKGKVFHFDLYRLKTLKKCMISELKNILTTLSFVSLSGWKCMKKSFMGSTTTQ